MVYLACGRETSLVLNKLVIVRGYLDSWLATASGGNDLLNNSKFCKPFHLTSIDQLTNLMRRPKPFFLLVSGAPILQRIRIIIE